MKDIDTSVFRKYAEEAFHRLRNLGNYYVIVQPLLGPPITEPRSSDWCLKHCDPSSGKLEEIAKIVRDLTSSDIIVRKTLTFG
jgi:pyruvate formate lyase activating enzyme